MISDNKANKYIWFMAAINYENIESHKLILFYSVAFYLDPEVHCIVYFCIEITHYVANTR